MPDAKKSVEDVLGPIVGALSRKGVAYGREATRQAMRDVRANNARMAQCHLPHDFVPEDPKGRLLRRLVCTKCGAWLEAGHAYWYCQGLKDAVGERGTDEAGS